ncbi:DUF2252 family protein [Rhodovulum strictum]
MAESPFGFLRGSAAVMARDLAHTPRTGLEAMACGDMHVGNFGVFASRFPHRACFTSAHRANPPKRTPSPPPPLTLGGGGLGGSWQEVGTYTSHAGRPAPWVILGKRCHRACIFR